MGCGVGWAVGGGLGDGLSGGMGCWDMGGQKPGCVTSAISRGYSLRPSS